MRIYFQHAPKTAGTAVIYNLDRYFSLDEMLGPIAQHNYLSTQPERIAAARFTTGHLARLPHLFDVNPFLTVTTMRDPVERMLSMVRHLTEAPDYNSTLGIGEKSVEEALEVEAVRQQMENWSYCVEFGTDHARPLTLQGMPPAPPLERFGDQRRIERRLHATQRAKQMLRQTYVMDVTTLAEDVRRLSMHIAPDWQIAPMRKANIRGSRMEVSDAFRSRIEALFPEDFELYALSRELAGIIPEVTQPKPTVLERFGFEKPIRGLGWSGRMKPANNLTQTGRYFDVNGASLPIATQGLSEITISMFLFGSHVRANEELDFAIDGHPMTMAVIHPNYPETHHSRLIGSFRLWSPKPEVELTITPRKEFVETLDLKNHYFNDFGMHCLNYVYFLEVTGI